MSHAGLSAGVLHPSLFAEPVRDANISFEFFPPKTPKMEETLWQSIKKLEPLDPAFVSVTYGAGGSTRERTHRTVKRIVEETSLVTAAHLTCVGASRDEVNDVIRQYKDDGVNHIVALRGDAPEGVDCYTPHPDGYVNAEDLVKGIRDIGDFEISVAAYPEKHPDSPTLAADLENLKRKVDAGATRAITQLFFEPDVYFRFLDHCQSYGIDVPIVPGVLPVTTGAMLRTFVANCGANVPAWLSEMFDGLDDRPETRKMVAAAIAAEQVRKLYAGGVRDFHFYTANRADLTFAICHMLGHRPPAGTPGE
ncbi:methylenetetrahydrofolate reductase [Kordiimonas sediminis]|uniref:Methylenetetrahydrofolate reductase n=1 Tax=Kordiimonas sediminis TaxID=1735581 RepID=A0A919ASG9_9PROT|nr:methylenetetrahydrofolate reductase [NAD(P)H] [Kordiimonas sediminis]GHF24056.1 methylenetetrahydrofolate reductase [Kordiimonas sediminis]